MPAPRQAHQRHRTSHTCAILLDERAIEEELHERRPAGIGRGENRHAQHADQEDLDVRPQVAEQPAVRRQRPGRQVQVGLDDGALLPMLTVAILICR